MGLTRPRAHQILDIDYKQAVRVAAVSNVTLSGGAPATVDDVSLSANDRVLVTGQSTASQNGIYYVQTLGNGSNGTWVRGLDANATGELFAGMIVMVTEGTAYSDKLWSLTTNGAITIGTTSLTFALTGGTGNAITSGTSHIKIAVEDGNANVNIAGTSNVVVFASTGVIVTGITTVSGNITGGNVITGGLASVTGNITGGNVITAGLISVTGNATGGNLITAGLASVTGNVTGGNLITGGLASVTGNVTGGNLITGGLASVTGNITGGNLITAGLASVTGNITGGNILGNGAGLSGILAFGNVTVSNGNSAVANSISSTLTLTAGTGISITANAASDTITFATSSTTSIFSSGGDMGLVTSEVTVSEDLGLVTDTPASIQIDMETVAIGGPVYPSQLVIPSYAVAGLPSVTPAAQLVYVSDESGGAVPAFSDGTNWRRVTDRAVVT